MKHISEELKKIEQKIIPKKDFKILWTRSDYGTLIITARSEEESREKFEQGNYKDVDLNIKNGSIEIEGVETL